jgi:hypothetical protein
LDGPSLRLRAFGTYHDATGIMMFSLRSKPASHPPRAVAYVEQPPEAPVPSHAITVMTGVPAEGTGAEYEAGSKDGDKFRSKSLRIVIPGQMKRRGKRLDGPCLTIDETRNGAERNPSCAASCGHSVQA